MWVILSVIAIVSLVTFCLRGSNAVWGGATVGLIIGVIVAIIRNGFIWTTVGKGIVVGALVGLITEILHLLSKRKG